MTSNPQALVFLLRQLAGGEPWAEEVLVAGLRLAYRHEGLTRAEALEVIRLAEEAGWIVGVNDPLRGRLWSITAKGRLKVQEVS